MSVFSFLLVYIDSFILPALIIFENFNRMFKSTFIAEFPCVFYPVEILFLLLFALSQVKETFSEKTFEVTNLDVPSFQLQTVITRANKKNMNRCRPMARAVKLTDLFLIITTPKMTLFFSELTIGKLAVLFFFLEMFLLPITSFPTVSCSATSNVSILRSLPSPHFRNLQPLLQTNPNIVGERLLAFFRQNISKYFPNNKHVSQLHNLHLDLSLDMISFFKAHSLPGAFLFRHERNYIHGDIFLQGFAPNRGCKLLM